jgi:hypothetical protein
MTTEEVRRNVCDREGVLDDTGYTPHHCFFRSEYKKDDFDEEWNVEPIKMSLHDSIHHEGNRRLEIYYKKKALMRYCGEHKKVLEKILKQKSYGI